LINYSSVIEHSCRSPKTPLSWSSSSWYLRRQAYQSTGRPAVPNNPTGVQSSWFRSTNRRPAANTGPSDALSAGISFRRPSLQTLQLRVSLQLRSNRLSNWRDSPLKVLGPIAATGSQHSSFAGSLTIPAASPAVDLTTIATSYKLASSKENVLRIKLCPIVHCFAGMQCSFALRRPSNVNRL